MAIEDYIKEYVEIPRIRAVRWDGEFDSYDAIKFLAGYSPKHKEVDGDKRTEYDIFLELDGEQIKVPKFDYVVKFPDGTIQIWTAEKFKYSWKEVKKDQPPAEPFFIPFSAF